MDVRIVRRKLFVNSSNLMIASWYMVAQESISDQISLFCVAGLGRDLDSWSERVAAGLPVLLRVQDLSFKRGQA